MQYKLLRLPHLLQTDIFWNALNTAKILYGIYIAITICEATILRALGMPLFDSLTTTFGTVGTGGFGIRNDSIAGYSPAIQITITVFMILSGINYTAYF